MGWDAWIRTVEIEPAIDAAHAVELARSVETLLRSGCRVFHLNTRGLGHLEATDAVGLMAELVHRYDGILDVHNPAGYFGELAFAGADSVTFDAGAVDNVPAAVERGRDTGVQVGVAFVKEAPALDVAVKAAAADLVLCEFGGDGVVERLRRVSELLPDSVTIQFEGEISLENVRSFYRAGARLLVAGQAIFEREDLPRAYRRLVQALA